MVFPIPPTNLPDTSTASSPKIKVEAISKVSPVVLNDQVSVDPRTAVKLPDPVARTEQGALARNALSHSGLVGVAPHAGHAALLEGMASHASMMQGSLKPQSPELAKLLAQLANTQSSDGSLVGWPSGSEKPWRGPSGETLTPKQTMQNLLTTLASSHLFSARHLADVLGPKLLHPSGLDDVSLQEETIKVLENLSSESSSAKDTARLLLHGQLFWQGEFMPGVKAKLTREDAWDNDPDHPGQLLKGSKVSLEIDLPKSGPLKVIGLQFGESLRLRIETSPTYKATFKEHLVDLDARLKEQIALPVNYLLSDALGGDNES
jgi:hypothetical protein